MAIIVVLKFGTRNQAMSSVSPTCTVGDTEDIAWLQVLKFEYLYTTMQCQI